MNLPKDSISVLGNLLLCVLLILINSDSLAQLNDETGLPFIKKYEPYIYNADPINWNIIQDDRGIIYAANTRGLLEYDGSTWRLIQFPCGSLNYFKYCKDENGATSIIFPFLILIQSGRS
jgi:hypothetical protein